jgi:hypothetical protein
VVSKLNKAPSCTDILQPLQVNDAFKRDDLFLTCHPVDKNCRTSEATIMQVQKQATYLARCFCLMAVTTKIAVFWDMKPCSLVNTNQCFGGTCCLDYILKVEAAGSWSFKQTHKSVTANITFCKADYAAINLHLLLICQNFQKTFQIQFVDFNIICVYHALVFFLFDNI